MPDHNEEGTVHGPYRDAHGKEVKISFGRVVVQTMQDEQSKENQLTVDAVTILRDARF